MSTDLSWKKRTSHSQHAKLLRVDWLERWVLGAAFSSITPGDDPATTKKER